MSLENLRTSVDEAITTGEKILNRFDGRFCQIMALQGIWYLLSVHGGLVAVACYDNQRDEMVDILSRIDIMKEKIGEQVHGLDM